MQTTTNVYDLRNRLTERDDQDPDPSNGVTTDIPKTYFGYDLASNNTSTTDPLGNVTDVGFDHMMRQKTTTLADPDASGPLSRPVFNKAFNADGSINRDIQPLSNYTSYLYDTLNDRYQFQAKDSGGTVITTEDI